MSNRYEVTMKPENHDHLPKLAEIIDSNLTTPPGGVVTANAVQVDTTARCLPELMRQVENMAADAAMSLEIVISCDAEGHEHGRVIKIENGKQLI